MQEHEKQIIKVDGPVSLNNTVELPIDGLPPSIQCYIEAVYNSISGKQIEMDRIK